MKNCSLNKKCFFYTLGLNRVIISFCILFYANLSIGQQLPLHSQYMFDGYLLNPAYAGTKDYTHVNLSIRNQWTGFPDAPQTMTLSANGKLRDNMAIGGGLFNDQTGPTGRTGLMASYAFHVPFDNSTLSFGLSGMVFQYVLDKTKLTTLEPDDDAMQGELTKQLVPEATFGIHYFADNYYVGFAIPQLIEWKLNVGLYENSNEMKRHYFATAGYIFALSGDFELEPSLLVKATSAAPVQADVNLKVKYQSFLWLGCSYRTQESLIFMLGANKSNVQFGYAYDATLTNIKNYSSGSHEVFIGYRLGVKKGGKAMM